MLAYLWKNIPNIFPDLKTFIFYAKLRVSLIDTAFDLCYSIR